jgi:hypothetical protein
MNRKPSLRDLAALRSMRVATYALFTACLVAVFATAASAADCGDKVPGGRVACSCGDAVVTDTKLMPGDPVVSEPCSGDGLTLMPPSGSDGITINLNGLVLTGTGSGVGIRSERGGELGNRILGGGDGRRAEILGFASGIRGSGRNVLREVSAIDVHDNKHDGVSVRTSGLVMRDVNSHSNGRDGISLSGHDNELVDVVSGGNRRDGLQVRGSGTKVAAETAGNRRNGTVVGGRDNDVSSLHSNGNGAAGVHATGGNHKVSDLQTSGNATGDVTGRAGALQ